ncbi:MAG TPA: hypothetical protein VGI93_20140 [Steroidobacteraceae bacterium]|jgi:hypothetical protein
MKAYLAVTGCLFGLVGLAHLVRLFAESGHSLSDPAWLAPNLGLFVVGGGVAVWALRLYRHAASR